MEVNVHEAKTHFSKLLAQVEAGEEVIIARSGKPIARLVPFNLSPSKEWGFAKGEFVVPDDFDDPMPDFEEDFYK